MNFLEIMYGFPSVEPFLLMFLGAFTTNVVAAAPVVYCKKALDTSTSVG